MAERVVLLSIPQVRRRDVTPGALASLDRVCARGGVADLQPAFPSVSATAFASMITGKDPSDHGVVASAFLDRTLGRVHGPYLADSDVSGEKLWNAATLRRPGAKTMAWFTPNTTGADVDFWAAIDDEGLLKTQPEQLGTDLIRRFGPFPAPTGGPAGAAPRIETTAWALRTAAYIIETEQPALSVVRVPYLGHVARRYGPDGREAAKAIREFDRVLGPFLAGQSKGTALIAATETIATPVSEPVDVNRILRAIGCLRTKPLERGGLDVDVNASAAIAVVEHQICHVYVNQRDTIAEIAAAFSGEYGDGIEFVLQGKSRARVGIAHERAGEIVLISEPGRWFRGDWWSNPTEAPRGRCPSGLDSSSLRLVADPARVGGSIGAPPAEMEDIGTLVLSHKDLLGDREVVQMIDIYPMALAALAVG